MYEWSGSGADPRELPGTLVHSIGGLIVLLTTTVLSVFRPRGLTRYGWRKQRERPSRQPQRRASLEEQPAE